jgi:hypothetical protein
MMNRAPVPRCGGRGPDARHGQHPSRHRRNGQAPAPPTFYPHLTARRGRYSTLKLQLAPVVTLTPW